MEIDRRDLIRYGGTALLTIAILAALVWGGWALLRGKSPVDAALEEVRRLPLVGVVMADNAGVSVSETISEITVAAEMVTANCW